MADIVYIYPKTFCSNNNCDKEYSIQKGNPTNLSVSNGEVPSFFNCYSKVELNKRISPVKEDINNIYLLNPNQYNNKIAVGFDKVDCKTNSTPTYISTDPRLYNSARAEYLHLDRPPIDGNIKLKDIYNKNLNHYSLSSKPYTEIDDGQISYYIDDSIANAFHKPVYSEQSTQITNLYQDPMGSIKPEYNREALINTENPTTTLRKDFPEHLSFIQDTQSFREDLTALQQRKNNQTKWSARWQEQ